MGAKTFKKLGGDMDTLFSSKNVFLFGAGKPDPALSYATVKIGSLGVRIDLVSERWTYLTVEVSKLEKNFFILNIQERQLTIDGLRIQLTVLMSLQGFFKETLWRE